MSKHKHKPHRADDKRQSGYSGRVVRTVHPTSTGISAPLVGVIADRRDSPNGKGKRAR